jgi:hypothetical protein
VRAIGKDLAKEAAGLYRMRDIAKPSCLSISAMTRELATIYRIGSGNFARARAGGRPMIGRPTGIRPGDTVTLTFVVAST